MSDEKVEIVRRLYAAWAAGDVPGRLEDPIHADVEYVEPARGDRARHQDGHRRIHSRDAEVCARRGSSGRQKSSG